MFTRAITRKPGKNFEQGITTTFSSDPPNYELILIQHESYLETLNAIGLDIIQLESLPNFPDAYFVEDTAVVTSDVAVITNPGAESRKGEEKSIAAALAPFRESGRIQAPGTLDGGDVLQIGTHFLIGLSERTNQEGAEQLGRFLEKFGNTWTTIQVGAGLHLKSSVNYVGKNTILVTEEFANHEQLTEFELIAVDKSEAYAANTLWVNGYLLTPKGYPDTRQRLEKLKSEIIELDTSEIRKMDGGLTCMSIRF